MIITTHGDFPMKPGDLLLVKTGDVLHRIRVGHPTQVHEKKSTHYARIETSKAPARVHGSSNSVDFTGGH